MRALVLLLGVVVALGSATWIAWAQVGASGVIFGCMSPSGFIRGIDETTGSCRTGDQALSWYSRAGAEAAFLGNGAAAGGDLTGTYPNPVVAAGAVDGSKILDASITSADLGSDTVGTAAIQDGAVTAAKLDPSVSRLRSHVADVEAAPDLDSASFHSLVELPGSFELRLLCVEVVGITRLGLNLHNLSGQRLEAFVTTNPEASNLHVVIPAGFNDNIVDVSRSPTLARGHIQLPTSVASFSGLFRTTNPENALGRCTLGLQVIG